MTQKLSKHIQEEILVTVHGMSAQNFKTTFTLKPPSTL